MKIATVARNPEHSPNMTTNDTAILECITEELIKANNVVIALNEGDEIPDDTDVICHMSRNLKVLDTLEEYQERGITVINSPEAVKRCSRIEFMHILEENNIQQPTFRIIKDEKDFEGLQFPAWIKRGEGWSCHKDDVCFVTNKVEALEAIGEMQKRGIKTYVYTRHCEGDIIKFYGVEDKYFTYSYPNSNTKFGLEKINGKAHYYTFDTEKLRNMAIKAARAIGLDIYGGDCIIEAGGNIVMIDLNDFPSFSIVRDEAAKEISKLITDTEK